MQILIFIFHSEKEIFIAKPVCNTYIFLWKVEGKGLPKIILILVGDPS